MGCDVTDASDTSVEPVEREDDAPRRFRRVRTGIVMVVVEREEPTDEQRPDPERSR